MQLNAFSFLSESSLSRKHLAAGKSSPKAISFVSKFIIFGIGLYIAWHYIHHPLFAIQPYKFIAKYYIALLGTPIKWGILIFQKAATSGFTSDLTLNQVIGAVGLVIYASLIISFFIIIDKLFRKLGFTETIWTIILFGPAWIGIAWFIGTRIVAWANTY